MKNIKKVISVFQNSNSITNETLEIEIEQKEKFNAFSRLALVSLFPLDWGGCSARSS